MGARAKRSQGKGNKKNHNRARPAPRKPQYEPRADHDNLLILTVVIPTTDRDLNKVAGQFTNKVKVAFDPDTEVYRSARTTRPSAKERVEPWDFKTTIDAGDQA